MLARLREHLEAQPQVARVYNLITQQLGSDIVVAVKARMQPLGSDVALLEAINTMERDLRVAFPQVRWVFFEPDLRDRSGGVTRTDRSARRRAVPAACGTV